MARINGLFSRIAIISLHITKSARQIGKKQGLPVSSPHLGEMTFM